MKKFETLRYELDDGDCGKLTMSVRLRRTKAGYWSFALERGMEVDMAERALHHFAVKTGFDEKLIAALNATPRRGRAFPTISLRMPFFCDGEHFPDRASIMKLVDEVFLPSWRYAVERVMAYRPRGGTWMDAVNEVERKHIYGLDDAGTDPVEQAET